MDLTAYLTSLRTPVATMAGVEEDAVIIYAQQDLESAINDTLARHSAAILLGISTGTCEAPQNQKSPADTYTLEVIVYTPEMAYVMAEPRFTLPICEAIRAGLHGYTDPNTPPPRGVCHILARRRFSLAVDDIKGTRYLTGTCLFDFQHLPQPLP